MNQFFAPLAEPVGAIWSLMGLMVVRLLWRHQWRSAMWLGFPMLLLFVVGSTPVPELLVAAEERPWVVGAGRGDYATTRPRDCETQGSDLSPDRLAAWGGAGGTGQWRNGTTNDQSPGFSPQLPNLNSFAGQPGTEGAQPACAPADAVIALGGGQHVSHHDLLGFAMGSGGSRVLTAIELVRSGRARTLVLGGSWPMPGRPQMSSMCVVQDWVTSWGLAGVVTNLGICINTHDEAVAFRKVLLDQGWRKVLLVTSALHMRRSLTLFTQQGIVVTPVAADFQVVGVSQDLPFSPFPRQHRLDLMTLYLHEKIGWCLYRMKGWV